MSGRALGGKGVLRQVLKEVWLKGERGPMLIQSSYPVTIKYAAVWVTTPGATLLDSNPTQPRTSCVNLDTLFSLSVSVSSCAK